MKNVFSSKVVCSLLFLVAVSPLGLVACKPPCKPPCKTSDGEPTRAWGAMDEVVGTLDDDPSFEQAAKPLVDWATAHAGGNITIEIHCAPHIGGCSVTKKGGYFIPREVR